jgi:hypothetical protein
MPRFPRFEPRGPAKVATVAKVDAARPAARTNLRNIRSFSRPSSTAGENDRREDSQVSQLSLVGPPNSPDPADMIVVYTDRLAICSESGDVTEEAAKRTATEECGANLEDLITRQINYWRHRIEALPEPTERSLAAIKTTCLDALAQRWVHDAVRLGWGECAIFGLDPAAPTIHDRDGLLPGLAMSSLRDPVQLIEISPNAAVILTGARSRLRYFNTSRAGPPIWDHCAFRWLH